MVAVDVPGVRGEGERAFGLCSTRGSSTAIAASCAAVRWRRLLLLRSEYSLALSEALPKPLLHAGGGLKKTFTP